METTQHTSTYMNSNLRTYVPPVVVKDQTPTYNVHVHVGGSAYCWDYV